MVQIKFFDSTLRDGSHAVHQQISAEQISQYCVRIEEMGMNTVIVGHGNGLGASSIQMGLSSMDEMEMLAVAAKNLSRTKLGAFLTIGFGTVQDQIIPAIQNGVQVFCIAAHCTEADTMQRHIEFLAQRGLPGYGVLMNCHLANREILLEEAKKIERYGGAGAILMDSAGALTPQGVQEKVSYLREHLTVEIGFHAHNNLGLAVANAYTAIVNGAEIVDGTVGGFGAGAGNCQLEALAAVLEKEKIQTGLNLPGLLDISEQLIEKEFCFQKGVSAVSIAGGYAGVVSTMKPRVERISAKYGVDPKKVFLELGREKVVAGQDDMILEIAKRLHDKAAGNL